MFGEVRVYQPIPCWTGAAHSQPHGEQRRPEMCNEFANGYSVFFELCGALDAPNAIPSGSVRAQDFDLPSKGRILVAHNYRDGAFA